MNLYKRRLEDDAVDFMHGIMKSNNEGIKLKDIYKKPRANVLVQVHRHLFYWYNISIFSAPSETKHVVYAIDTRSATELGLEKLSRRFSCLSLGKCITKHPDYKENRRDFFNQLILVGPRPVKGSNSITPEDFFARMSPQKKSNSLPNIELTPEEFFARMSPKKSSLPNIELTPEEFFAKMSPSKKSGNVELTPEEYLSRMSLPSN